MDRDSLVIAGPLTWFRAATILSPVELAATAVWSS